MLTLYHTPAQVLRRFPGTVFQEMHDQPQPTRLTNRFGVVRQIFKAMCHGVTKLAEIQDAILRLEPKEQQALRHWLDETAEETPEMLAAIDEGLRSLAA